VRLRIAACGLNPADLLMIENRFQERPAPPYTLGMELAGTVEALGPGVTALAPGARVAVFSGHGGLAEAGCFAAKRCTVLPETMSFEHAAGFQIAYGASHLALVLRARLVPGETLLVLGAGGNVGGAAVEIGKHLGARVIAVSRGRERLAAAADRGADYLIDGEEGDLAAEVQALGGADVVFDGVGGDMALAALAATKRGGRYLVVGFASGKLPKFSANHLMVKNVTLHGFYWGGHLNIAPELLSFGLQTVFEWYRRGEITPRIGATLPLSRAAEAFDLLRAGATNGKIVVTIPG
jgi:NADPH2:quinone reductase